MKTRWFILGAVIAAVLQTGALARIVYDRAQLLQNGKEVLLRSGMVDPRDFFRGHYVVLNLEISRIDGTTLPVLGSPQAGEDVWVSLKPGDDEFWVPAMIYATFPETELAPLIKGKVRGVNDRSYTIDFPVDRFFAERERARDLEQVRRDRNLGVIVALSSTGNAAIKGISADGELIYVEEIW